MGFEHLDELDCLDFLDAEQRDGERSGRYAVVGEGGLPILYRHGNLHCSLYFGRLNNSAMTTSPSDQFTCLHCGANVTPQQKPKRTFMGFRKMLCPLCGKESKYPLTTGYAVVYWIFVIGNVLFALSVLAQGAFVPNPIGIVILIAMVASLAESGRIKRQIRAVQQARP